MADLLTSLERHTPRRLRTLPGEATRLLTSCRSPAMLGVAGEVQAVAGLSVPVLLEGETGVGKEVVARAIHEASPRAAEPFVAVNCAALPRELMESELFGYERGAFTGAHSRRVGWFEAAGRGTVLLDELGDMPVEVQVKLLRVLQEKMFRPLGTNREVRFRARILAATSRDLEAGIAAGDFRRDLFYRLAVVQLRVPPLRERPEDLAVLCENLLERYSVREQRPMPSLGPGVLERLAAAPWPGNIRELENVLISAAIRSPDAVIRDVRLREARSGEAPAGRGPSTPGAPVRADDILPLAEYERRVIEAALAATGGNVSETARRLGIGRATLRRKLGRSALDSEDLS